ncbi:hypothetical protein RD792_016193, partial [Penstemon davidsonii]
METRGLDNIDWSMVNIGNNPSTFPMPENHYQPFIPTGNHLHGVQENYPFPGLENIQNLELLNPTLPENFYTLESEFNRLSLSATPHPSAIAAPLPPGGIGGLSSRNYSSAIGLPNGAPLYPHGDLQRMRVQSAARGQMGSYVQPQQNYPALGHQENNLVDPFSINGNLNPPYDLNSIYNHARSLNVAATEYQPRGYRNGFRLSDEKSYDDPYWNRPNNSASLMYDSHNGYLNRSRHRRSYSSLEDLRGRILFVAKDQEGCRFLQKTFEDGKPEEIYMIYLELKDHIRELMVDQFGNYLIQKIFEVCSEEQMNQLLMMVVKDERSLVSICHDSHGTRAMQKMIETLTTREQRKLVISVLRRITVTLTKSMNGHHVIQHCLKFFPSEDNKHILNVVADNCLEIATDKSGCCVLQQCAVHAQGEPLDRLVAEITANVLILAEHPYGNYVVQYILGLHIPRATEHILSQLAGSYVSLSTNKYGSNVVEKCLKESEGDEPVQIINELVNSPNFLAVLQDPYGNYVAQSALTVSR